MAEFFLSVEQTFGAGHVIPDDPDCRFPGHGHQWNVRVTVRGLLDPSTGSSAKANALTEALGLVVAEVEGKSFNDMVPQSKPTLEGVGMWFLDRLARQFPKIVEVEVTWTDLHRSCSIRRELR